jgi:hypothetical protein
MRTRICLYILLLVPLAVYWQTAFSEYGMTSDYANLRQAREESGLLVKESASHGRPLYGAMLETSFSAAGQVEALHWLRLVTVLLLTLLGVVVWRQLYNSGWNEIEAAAIGLGVVLLPSAQVLVGWASAWPQALTLLLAAAGFSAIETEIERGGMKRIVALLGGCMIYTAAGLIYQANVLFALVIVTAVLLVRTGREPLSDRWWCTFHLAAVAVGLLVGRLIMGLLYSNGLFQPAANASGLSVLGFLRYPLPNSFALYALNDDEFTGWIIYWATALAVTAAIVLAYRKITRSEDQMIRRRGVYAVAALVIITVVVCFVAAERIATYRVLFSLAGILLVLMIYSLRVLTVKKKIRRKHYAGMAALALFIAFLAYRNSVQLIAEPQGVEWELMRGSVLRAGFTKPVRVHIITASLADRTTERTYGDEFGTVSSDAEAVARDMFVAALHERFSGRLPKGGSYTLAVSATDPDPSSYDLLIDMRRIRPAKS